MQFRKPQVQKLCFIPPKIIFIEVHFWLEKILGLKKKFGWVLLVVLVPLVTWVITPLTQPKAHDKSTRQISAFSLEFDNIISPQVK